LRLCFHTSCRLDRIAKEVGSRAKAFKLVRHDKKLVRFLVPLTDKALRKILEKFVSA